MANANVLPFWTYHDFFSPTINHHFFQGSHPQKELPWSTTKKNIKSGQHRSNQISDMTNFINTKTLRFDKSTFDIVDHWWKATWLMKHQYINGLFLRKAVDKKTWKIMFSSLISGEKNTKKTHKITVKSSKFLTKSSHNS
jgi:hypothetical protein